MTEETGKSLLDLSSVDLSAVVPTLTAVIGSVIGIAVTVAVIRKGYGWFMSFLKRA